jgi:hypothetical protein
MKIDISHLHLHELSKVFSTSNPVPKSTLRSFYSRFDSELTEQAFRRILYKLEKRQVYNIRDDCHSWVHLGSFLAEKT